MSYLFIYLFVLNLATFSQLLKLYSVEWKGDKWMMNWKGRARKRSWPNPRYCPDIQLEGLRNTTKTSVGIVGLRAEIWTLDLPNTKHSTSEHGVTSTRSSGCQQVAGRHVLCGPSIFLNTASLYDENTWYQYQKNLIPYQKYLISESKTCFCRKYLEVCATAQLTGEGKSRTRKRLRRKLERMHANYNRN
jgi:hypothetical protein